MPVEKTQRISKLLMFIVRLFTAEPNEAKFARVLRTNRSVNVMYVFVSFG